MEGKSASKGGPPEESIEDGSAEQSEFERNKEAVKVSHPFVVTDAPARRGARETSSAGAHGFLADAAFRPAESSAIEPWWHVSLACETVGAQKWEEHRAEHSEGTTIRSARMVTEIRRARFGALRAIGTPI